MIARTPQSPHNIFKGRHPHSRTTLFHQPQLYFNSTNTSSNASSLRFPLQLSAGKFPHHFHHWFSSQANQIKFQKIKNSTWQPKDSTTCLLPKSKAQLLRSSTMSISGSATLMSLLLRVWLSAIMLLTTASGPRIRCSLHTQQLMMATVKVCSTILKFATRLTLPVRFKGTKFLVHRVTFKHTFGALDDDLEMSHTLNCGLRTSS